MCKDSTFFEFLSVRSLAYLPYIVKLSNAMTKSDDRSMFEVKKLELVNLAQ